MSYIARHMENRILELSKSYSAILLTGPRQSGKTTMLRALSKEENKGREYVSLDDLTTRDMAKNDPALFLQIHKPPVFIDEVQYAPELFTYIKIHIDEHHNPGDFWMTGSQIFRLMRGVQESLAGRVALLHMSPLSQREIIGADCIPFTTNMNVLMDECKKIAPVDTPTIFERIWRGSMPGIVSGLYADRNMYYSSYLSTYVERDVRDISGTADALKFNRFITAVAARTAQLLNYHALAEDAEIDMVTAKAWVDILETLGIIFLLHPYSNNVLKRTIKTPKVYFYDTGLVCYLTKWSSPEVAESGAMSGALLENFTVSEILKGKLCPLEIKKTATPDKRIIRTFGVIDKSPLQLGTGAVLCMAEQFGAFDRDNLIVPIWAI